MVSQSRSASSSPEPSDTMQLFIKPISGDIITLTVPQTITTEKLTTLLSIRTRLPPSDLRLVHAGHHLASSDVLTTRNIRNGSTITLASPVRGGMPPKKIRCGAKDGGVQCREGVSRIVGECGFCGGCFCGKHRLLEDHKCTGLEDVSAHPAFASFSAGNTPNQEKREEELFPVVKPVKEKGELVLGRQQEKEAKENERRKTSSELSVRELGVVIDHDGSVKNVGRLAGVQEGKSRAQRKHAEQ